MKKTYLVLTIFLTIFICGVSNLSAEIITINVNASITKLRVPSLMSGQLNIGDTLSGSYTYNSVAPDTNPETNVADYHYANSKYGITLNGGGFVFKTDPAKAHFDIEIIDGTPPSADHYILMSYNNLNIYDNMPINFISLNLGGDILAKNFNDTSLPTTAPELTAWPYNSLEIRFGAHADYYIDSTLTSAILAPEPATLSLLALGGLILRKKK